MLGAGEKVQVRPGEQPRLMSVVSGGVRLAAEGAGGTRSPFRQKLVRGESVLLPYGGTFAFVAETTTILLLTENFAGTS